MKKNVVTATFLTFFKVIDNYFYNDTLNFLCPTLCLIKDFERPNFKFTFIIFFKEIFDWQLFLQRYFKLFMVSSMLN
jgi:hypothetical protein